MLFYPILCYARREGIDDRSSRVQSVGRDFSFISAELAFVTT